MVAHESVPYPTLKGEQLKSVKAYLEHMPKGAIISLAAIRKNVPMTYQSICDELLTLLQTKVIERAYTSVGATAYRKR